MKKIIALVLTAVLIMVAAPFAFAEATVHEVGTIADLESALANAAAGDTIQLTADITLTEQLVIDKAITLDGAGFKITATQADTSVKYGAINDYMIDVRANATIKDLVIDGGEANVMGIQFYACQGVLENVAIENIGRYYPVHLNGAEVQVVGDLNLNGCVKDGYYVFVAVGYGANMAAGTKSALTMADGASIADGTIVFVPEDLANAVASNGTMYAAVNDSAVVGNAQAKIGNTYYATLEYAINAAREGETVTMTSDITMNKILVIDKAITLDGGNPKGGNFTLTSKTGSYGSGRAINVKTSGNVTIQNLTVTTTEERGINVITYPVNLQLSNVHVTAGNYALNAASAAGATKITADNCTFTGKNAVNIAAPGSKVTLNECTINCKDTSSSEAYGAICTYITAENAVITITGGAVNIEDDEATPSNPGYICADGATIAFNESVAYTKNGEAVDISVANGVAFIRYGNYGYSFQSLADAIAYAKSGETIELVGTLVVAEDMEIVVSGEIISGNVQVNEGVTLTISGNGTFDFNPTAYLAEGYTVAVNSAGKYVVSKQVTVGTGSTSGAESKGEVSTEVEDKTDITAEDVQSAVNSNTTTNENLADVVKKDSALQNVVDNVDKEEAAEKIQEAFGGTVTQENVTVEVRPYLDVVADKFSSTSHSVTNSQGETVQVTTNTLVLKIEPKYDVVAVAGDKACVVESGTLTNVTKPVSITVPVPENFVTNNSTLYIKHVKDGGKEYIYEATLSADGTTATFVNPNGFSQFEMFTSTTKLQSYRDVKYNLNLESYMDFSFFIDQDELTKEDGYVVTVQQGNDVTTITNWEQKDGYWRFRYADVAPAEYEDELTLTIKDGDGTILVQDTTTMKAYIELRISRQANDMSMMQALLSYCNAAKTYFSSIGDA